MIVQDPKVPLGHERSGHWRSVRAAHLLTHPACAACGGTDHLECHHIVPFHVDSSRELDPSNIIVLCEHPSHNDHLIFGHFLNFKHWNPNVVHDAIRFLAGLHAAIAAARTA